MKQVTAFNPAAVMTETIKVNSKADDIYNAVLDITKSEKLFKKVKSSDKKLRRISLVTKVSAFSYGELMTIAINEIGGGTSIAITSEPKTMVGTQSVGAQSAIGVKNRKNIEAFIASISKRINMTAYNPTEPQSCSVADEIQKFKSLLDTGAITQDEFDSKKKQLLSV